jgi:hypothetical protein
MGFEISRRSMLQYGAAAGVFAASGTAMASPAPDILSPQIMRQAMVAFFQHRGRLEELDRIGIVDFSRPSSDARLFIVDIATGTAQSHLVAHGRGSDPAATGWARRFSNDPGSFASSAGAFMTGAEYTGQHGRSMRLSGLEAENCNAESRAIVVHAAWYVTPELASRTGKLGRSEGCFAVSKASLNDVLDQLGAGRLLFAAKA